MSGPFGVTPAGFVLKSVQQLLSELQAELLGLIDPTTDVSPDVPLGQLLGVTAKKLGEVWQLAQVAFNATSRGDAEDVLLDNIGALTGTIRQGETASTVPCTAQFSIAGTHPAGSLAAYVAGAPSQQWTNKFDVVVPANANSIAGITPAPPITPTSPGSPVSATNPYTATNIVWQATAVGPDYGTALEAADNLSGPGQLNQIVAAAGWLNVFDAGGITVGTLVETDPDYRVSQYEELSAPGACTLPAIQAALLRALAGLAITPPPAVRMVENTGLTTDPTTGVPAKSFMAVVFDGNPAPTGSQLTANDQLIQAALLANKPAGETPFGSYLPALGVVDELGNVQTLPFTRAAAVPIYAAITVAVAASMTGAQRTALQSTIQTALQAATRGQAITLYGGTFTPTTGSPVIFVPGQDVILSALRSIVQGQAGVIDVPVFYLGTAPPPTGTANLPIAIGQVATIPDPLATYIAVTPVTFVP